VTPEQFNVFNSIPILFAQSQNIEDQPWLDSPLIALQKSLMQIKFNTYQSKTGWPQKF
jgi:hypothetical protein